MFMKRANARELDVKKESSSESDSDWYLNYDYYEKFHYK